MPPSITRRCSSTPPTGERTTDTSATIRRRKITRRCSNFRPTSPTTPSRVQLDHAGSVQRHALGAEHELHLQRRHLSAGSDEEQIALGDNFLSKIVPEIEASQAYKNNGMIVIWNDETEGDEDADRPPALTAPRSSSRRSPRATPTQTTFCIRTRPIWSRCRTSSGSLAAAPAAISGRRAARTRSPICSSPARSPRPSLSRRLGS